MSAIRLGVNVDHVATLRQARGTPYPDPVLAALAAEDAGADGITVHLREDRRHIRERDVRLLRELLATKLNLEMAVVAPMIAFARELRPQDVCLVPERREELTTEGGLDVAAEPARYRDAVAELAEAGIRISLFLDPEARQIEAAAAAGAAVVELHTGAYANAENESSVKAELERLRDAAKRALDLGLIVNAGHGLHYRNVRAICALPGLDELNIGHAIVARALFSGMGAAVAEMKALLR